MYVFLRGSADSQVAMAPGPGVATNSLTNGHALSRVVNVPGIAAKQCNVPLMFGVLAVITLSSTTSVESTNKCTSQHVSDSMSITQAVVLYTTAGACYSLCSTAESYR